MAEEEGKQDEDKLEFTPEGETFGYISLDLLSAEESEGYYRVRLSYRPDSHFRGRPGVEQFTIDKTGPIEIRQVVSEPRPSDTRNLVVVAIVAAVAVGGAVGGLFASGALSSSSDVGNAGVGATALVIVPIVPDSAARLISPDGDVTIDVGAGAVTAASQLIYVSVLGRHTAAHWALQSHWEGVRPHNGRAALNHYHYRVHDQSLGRPRNQVPRCLHWNHKGTGRELFELLALGNRNEFRLAATRGQVPPLPRLDYEDSVTTPVHWLRPMGLTAARSAPLPSLGPVSAR